MARNGKLKDHPTAIDDLLEQGINSPSKIQKIIHAQHGIPLALPTICYHKQRWLAHAAPLAIPRRNRNTPPLAFLDWQPLLGA